MPPPTARKKPFPVPTSVPQSTCDAVSDEMVQQVATVMPQVPVETIRKDLCETILLLCDVWLM